MAGKTSSKRPCYSSGEVGEETVSFELDDEEVQVWKQPEVFRVLVEELGLLHQKAEKDAGYDRREIDELVHQLYRQLDYDPKALARAVEVVVANVQANSISPAMTGDLLETARVAKDTVKNSLKHLISRPSNVNKALGNYAEPVLVRFATNRHLNNSTFENAIGEQLRFGTYNAFVPTHDDSFPPLKDISVAKPHLCNFENFNWDQGDINVVIHGIDNSFDQACLFAATWSTSQRKNVLLFTWPNASFANYTQAKDLATFSFVSLWKLLQKLNRPYNIVGHSMGCFVANLALQVLPAISKLHCKEMVWAHPDVMDHHTVLEGVLADAPNLRILVVFHPKDFALRLSASRFANNQTRMGRSTAQTTTSTTIDGSQIFFVDVADTHDGDKNHKSHFSDMRVHGMISKFLEHEASSLFLAECEKVPDRACTFKLLGKTS